jgi:hypothetical protein
MLPLQSSKNWGGGNVITRFDSICAFIMLLF